MVTRGMATRRLNTSLPVDVYEALEILAREQGKTLTDVVGDSIKLHKWVRDNRAEEDRLPTEIARDDVKFRQWLRENSKDGARVLIERDGSRELVRV